MFTTIFVLNSKFNLLHNLFEVSLLIVSTFYLMFFVFTTDGASKF